MFLRKDLREGDYFIFNGEVTKFNGQEWEDGSDNAKPIPLTPKFLRLNGFYGGYVTRTVTPNFGLLKAYIKNGFPFIVCVGDDEWCYFGYEEPDISGDSNFIPQIKMRFVHEFQQLYRFKSDDGLIMSDEI